MSFTKHEKWACLLSSFECLFEFFSCSMKREGYSGLRYPLQFRNLSYTFPLGVAHPHAAELCRAQAAPDLLHEHSAIRIPGRQLDGSKHQLL